MQSKTVVSTFAALGAVALLVLSGEARAQFSATVTGTSDYDFRGVSLSAKNPALQASLDYALPNGFAIGIWGSNIDSDFYDFDADEQVNIDDDYEIEPDDSEMFPVGDDEDDADSNDDDDDELIDD